MFYVKLVNYICKKEFAHFIKAESISADAIKKDQ